jgi:hypothetical protein
MASERARWVRIFTGDVLRTSISDAANLARVRLAAWLMDRSARDYLSPEEACQATLKKADLLLITGKSRRSKQFEILGEFASYERINLVACGDYVAIDWPNFVKFLPPASRRSGDRRADADSDSDSDADADADAARMAFEEGKKRKEAFSERDDADLTGPTPDVSYPPWVPEVLQGQDPNLAGDELEALAHKTWTLFQGSDANKNATGFRPFVEANWPFQ